MIEPKNITIKFFYPPENFMWGEVTIGGATLERMLEDVVTEAIYARLGDDVVSVTLMVPDELVLRWEAHTT